MFAVVRKARFAGEDIVGDNGAAHSFAQVHLRLVFSELTSAHQDCSALHLERVAAFFFVIPLDESAIAEANCAVSCDFGDLIARPPKGAVYEPSDAVVVGTYFNHRRVGSVEG